MEIANGCIKKSVVNTGILRKLSRAMISLFGDIKNLLNSFAIY